MSDWTLPLESTQEQRDYNVEENVMENQVSETQLISSGQLIGIKCKTSALTYAQFQLYQAFYDSKKGPLTPFTYTSRMDGVEYIVRFVKDSFKISNTDGYFQCEFSLKRVF